MSFLLKCNVKLISVAHSSTSLLIFDGGGSKKPLRKELKSMSAQANGKKMKTYFFDLSDLGMFTKLLAQVSIRFFLKRHSGKEYVY